MNNLCIIEGRAYTLTDEQVKKLDTMFQPKGDKYNPRLIERKAEWIERHGKYIEQPYFYYYS